MKIDSMISVLMPVYNAEKYLDAAIISILQQSEHDWELIIIDDGSTDQSLSVIQKYAANDKRIKYTTRDNKGTVFTRNEAIQQAKSDIIAWADADDVSLPDRLIKQASYLRDNPKCVAVGSRILLVDSEGLPLIEMVDKFTHQDIVKSLLDGIGLVICQPASMIRKQAIEAINGFRPEVKSAEDIDFWLHLSEIGELANLPDILLKYRQHVSSEGYENRERQHFYHKAALLDAYKRRKLDIPDWLSSLNTQVSTDQLSEADHHRKWAWWALQGGHIKSARKHAILALKKKPFELENWRVLACAVRGR